MNAMKHYILSRLRDGEEIRSWGAGPLVGRLVANALHALGEEGCIDVEARGEIHITDKGTQYLKENPK